MVVCSAFSCKNEKGKVTGKSFHSFPFSKPFVLSKWVEAVNRPGWFPKKHSVLCSDHFKESDFDRTGQTTRLRVGSIPCFFIHKWEGNEVENIGKQSLYRINYTDGEIVMENQISQTAVAEKAIMSTEAETIINSPLLVHQYANLKRKFLQEREKKFVAQKKLKLLNRKLNRMTKRVTDLKQMVRNLLDQL